MAEFNSGACSAHEIVFIDRSVLSESQAVFLGIDRFAAFSESKARPECKPLSELDLEIAKRKRPELPEIAKVEVARIEVVAVRLTATKEFFARVFFCRDPETNVVVIGKTVPGIKAKGASEVP